jgi:hypothetical protein
MVTLKLLVRQLFKDIMYNVLLEWQEQALSLEIYKEVSILHDKLRIKFY